MSFQLLAFMEIINANFAGWSSKYYPKLRYFEGVIWTWEVMLWIRFQTNSTSIDVVWTWIDRRIFKLNLTYLKNVLNFKLELQWMSHWIRKVSQLMFKCCYFDFSYCDFDVDHLVFEIQISFYCHFCPQMYGIQTYVLSEYKT